MTRTKKYLGLGCLLLLVAVGIAAFVLMREEPPDTRFNAAYRLDDGRLAVVSPYRGTELRLRLPAEGVSRPLTPIDRPTGDLVYEVGSTGSWAAPEELPEEETVTFEMAAGGPPEGFLWRRDGEELSARRIELREDLFTFESDGYELRAKLVLPPGELPDAGDPDPHPAVVLVHGSGDRSAVDTWDDPYHFAALGIATLVYDKRGTGGSQGTYTQNFHVLARDVVAAVEAVRTRDGVDPADVHLAGFSQGGWIAPLAASQTDAVRSILVGYGPMVPIIDEDRWGYVYTLRKKGFGPEAVAEADRIHEAIVAILDHGATGRWDEVEALLGEAEGEPWFDALSDSDSTLGFLSANRNVPLWAVRLYAWWMMRPIDGEPRADRLYDPVPVVAELEVPSLWIFGGDDHSMPTAWTIEELVRLQASGAPIEILLFPEADHGITRYEENGEGGRRFVGYEPEYHPAMVEWLVRWSDRRPRPL